MTWRFEYNVHKKQNLLFLKFICFFFKASLSFFLASQKDYMLFFDELIHEISWLSLTGVW